jgi:hypothetical protein
LLAFTAGPCLDLDLAIPGLVDQLVDPRHKSFVALQSVQAVERLTKTLRADRLPDGLKSFVDPLLAGQTLGFGTPKSFLPGFAILFFPCSSL